MRRLCSGCAVVISLGLTACTEDPVSRTPESRALDGDGQGIAYSLRGGDAGGPHVAILDECDPTDPGWAPTGGCLLPRGAVTFAEFNALVMSPLSVSVVGHPAWRNEPSYLEIADGRSVRVTNDGGRLHTLTEVAQFGGGRVPPLNAGLIPAPECLVPLGTPDPSAVAPGGTMRIEGLAPGIHRFQCCIHPWMRELIRVEPSRSAASDGHAGH